MPPIEDPAEWLVKEADLPANVDPADPKLADPEARARMARCSSAASTTPPATCCRCSAGTPCPTDTRWITEKWRTRRGKLFLVAGDSPVGYRLPLGALKHVAPHRLSACACRGSAERAAELPESRNCCPAGGGARRPPQPSPSLPSDSTQDIPSRC
jgi:uncharacterized protein (DUF2126 family)